MSYEHLPGEFTVEKQLKNIYQVFYLHIEVNQRDEPSSLLISKHLLEIHRHSYCKHFKHAFVKLTEMNLNVLLWSIKGFNIN